MDCGFVHSAFFFLFYHVLLTVLIRGVQKTNRWVGNDLEEKNPTKPNQTVPNIEIRLNGFPNLNGLFRSKTGVPIFLYCKTD
jgi:hypothetical protein